MVLKRWLTGKLVDPSDESPVAQSSRYDFGPGLAKCAICSGRTLNRGCGESKRVVCNACWSAYQDKQNEADKTDNNDCTPPAERVNYRKLPSVGTWMHRLPRNDKNDTHSIEKLVEPLGQVSQPQQPLPQNDKKHSPSVEEAVENEVGVFEAVVYGVPTVAAERNRSPRNDKNDTHSIKKLVEPVQQLSSHSIKDFFKRLPSADSCMQPLPKTEKKVSLSMEEAVENEAVVYEKQNVATVVAERNRSPRNDKNDKHSTKKLVEPLARVSQPQRQVNLKKLPSAGSCKKQDVATVAGERNRSPRNDKNDTHSIKKLVEPLARVSQPQHQANLKRLPSVGSCMQPLPQNKKKVSSSVEKAVEKEAVVYKKQNVATIRKLFEPVARASQPQYQANLKRLPSAGSCMQPLPQNKKKVSPSVEKVVEKEAVVYEKQDVATVAAECNQDAASIKVVRNQTTHKGPCRLGSRLDHSCRLTLATKERL